MTSKKEDDLNLKIGTPDEVLWKNVLREAKGLKEQSENNLKIQTEMIALAERKIKEEKDKLLPHTTNKTEK